jgi:hypothetical protein
LVKAERVVIGHILGIALLVGGSACGFSKTWTESLPPAAIYLDCRPEERYIVGRPYRVA